MEQNGYKRQSMFILQCTFSLEAILILAHVFSRGSMRKPRWDEQFSSRKGTPIGYLILSGQPQKQTYEQHYTDLAGYF